MADVVRVRIDLARLAANLSAADGVLVTEAGARVFLKDIDFIEIGGGVWACEEVSCGLLDPTEVVFEGDDVEGDDGG